MLTADKVSILSSSGSTQYAEQWTSEYRCSDVNKFITDFKFIKSFAYSSKGLNLTTSGAKNYAKANINSLCAHYPLKQEFKKHYDFAYSSRGLNYTSSKARKYAKEIVEPEAFSCQNF